MVAPEFQFSLVSDPLLRLQRALRFAPRDTFGAPRRAVLLALATWLPIVIWAVFSGRIQLNLELDAMLRHLGVHVRCLIAIPLFILSEPLADLYFGAVVANFVPSGLIPEDERSRFAAVLRSVERWRDSKLVWAGLVALVAASTMAAARSLGADDPDSLAWARGPSGVDFGAAWAIYVVRPLFLFLTITWLWRLVLSWILLRRIARLDLSLVASHPDGVGGVGFVELHAAGFTLVIGAISSVACATVAHQILNHGAQLAQFKAQLVSLGVLLVALFLAPLTSFSGPLRRVLRRARFQYGTLAARQVRGVHAKWIEGRDVDDPILDSSELGPTADVATLYQLATRMRVVPIGKIALGAVLVPTLVPILLVATTEMPLTDILVKMLGMLK